MHQQLKEKLWAFIVHNNPELMFQLQEDYSVTKYLEEKISSVMPTALRLLEEDKAGHAIIELCMEELTLDLRPSKYQYIKKVLKSEFESHYERFKGEGTLTYETINMIEPCKPVFSEQSFSEEHQDKPLLWAAITAVITEYLHFNHPATNDQ